MKADGKNKLLEEYGLDRNTRRFRTVEQESQNDGRGEADSPTYISFGRGTTSNDRLHEGEIRSEQSTDLGGVESTSGETLGESSETQTSERGTARVESVDGLRMRVCMA